MAKQVKRATLKRAIKTPKFKNPTVKKSDFDKALRAMTKPRPRAKKKEVSYAVV